MALSFTRPIFNSSLASRVSNCITEVPNNINLEILPDKLLKIKTGTIFYVPTGIDNFVETILSKDIICPKLAQSNGEFIVYLSKSEEVFLFATIDQYSAFEKPAATGTHVFYNLTDNTIKTYTDDILGTTDIGLPIARVILKDGYIDNIKEIFNGFGYMSEIPYMLPEVRAFIPKGLDDQCDYVSYEFINNKVKIIKNLVNEACTYLLLTEDGNLQGWNGEYFEQPEKPVGVFSHAIWYDSYNNIMYETTTGDNNFLPITAINLGKVKKAGSNKRITEFKIKRSFALQQNALSQNIDDSVTSYPSNKAVQIYVENNGGAADNKTINKNINKKLQAIGIVEKNKGIIKYDWIGTKDEWIAQDLENTHPDWICYIIDDASEEGGSGTGNPDNITITINAQKQLQSIGTLEQNTKNPIYDWIGTKEEHTAQNIATEHPNWVCYITNDTEESSSSVKTDNLTITKNTKNEIQVSGIIEKNKNTPEYNWTGTLEEYNTQDIANLHPDWVCYIIDDTVSGESVYTKSEVDILLANLGDFVVDYYPKTDEEKAQANGDWWRLYKSGWLEQGGKIGLNISKVPFTKPFRDIPVFFTTETLDTTDNSYNGCTATSTELTVLSYSKNLRIWYAKGWGENK